MLIASPQTLAYFEYVDYKRERSTRAVFVIGWWHGHTSRRVADQWFLRGKDMESQTVHDFAMVDIQALRT